MCAVTRCGFHRAVAFTRQRIPLSLLCWVWVAPRRCSRADKCRKGGAGQSGSAVGDGEGVVREGQGTMMRVSDRMGACGSHCGCQRAPRHCAEEWRPAQDDKGRNGDPFNGGSA
eukprot:2110967-Rhodomonas_salina.1